MPLIAYSKERDERRLVGILYAGTLALLLILLYATYSNMQRHTEAVAEVRKYNLALIELNVLLSSLQDQETATRGYLLTNDGAYLEPYHRASGRDKPIFSELDTLLESAGWRVQLGILRVNYHRVEGFLEELIAQAFVGPALTEEEAELLDQSKAAMNAVRIIHARMVSQIELEREAFLPTATREGLDAPIMLVLYSALAIAATALLFWRLSRSLRISEEIQLTLQVKVADLDKEIGTRTSVQGMLQNVLDISPNGIMAFRALRDGAGTIVDFEILSSNQEANAILLRDDLVGERLLARIPEHFTAGLFEAYVHVVKTGVPFRKDLHYAASGADLWFSTHAVRFEDGFMVTFTDITEQKRAQEINAETDRIALTEQITRTVAHEVRNPLTNIHLAVEQLHDEVQDRDELVLTFFQIIDRNLKRIGTLINGMLESSRKRDLSLEPCSMQDIVNTAMKHVEDRSALKQIKGEAQVATGLPEVLADRELINLAVSNIAVNAVEAMEPGKGRLTMKVHRVGDEMLMEIADNGKGIAPQNLNRLFEPFYSGRPGGLGLGLTTTRTILNSHQIKLDVRSTVGAGTTFTLRLPSSIFVPDLTGDHTGRGFHDRGAPAP